HDRVEQADRDDAVHRRGAAAQHGGQHQQRVDRGERGQQLARRDPGHQRRADETAEHGTAPVPRDVLRRLLLAHVADVGHRQVVDHEAADRHLGADVEEDAQHAEQQVRVAQHVGEAMAAVIVLVGGLGQCRQPEHPHEQRQQEQHHRQPDVRELHRLRLLGVVEQALRRFQRGEFLRVLDHVGENQQAAEQRGEEGRVEMQRRGRPEAQRANAGDRQPGHDALLVAQCRDHAPGRHAHQEIRTEKGELHQDRLGVVELEDRLQVRDQDVVEAGEEAPHEEDRGEHAQRQPAAGVGRAGCAVVRREGSGAGRRSDRGHGDSGAGGGRTCVARRASNRANVTVSMRRPITRCNMRARVLLSQLPRCAEIAMTLRTPMLFALLACAACPSALAASGHAGNVDPRIGTGGDGHTFPGATVPFGMIQLSPDTAMPDFKHAYKWAAGYQYGDPTIMGFSHTHFSGSGHSDLGDVLVMPIAGDVKLDPGDPAKPGSGYRSRFSHASEVEQAGYYAVTLSDYGVRAELTASTRIGWHRYTFPKDRPAHLLLDLRPSIYDYPGKVLWSRLRVRADGTVSGCRTTRGWAPGRELCFAMRFSQTMVSRTLYDRESDVLYKGFKGPGNQPEDHDAENG